MRGLYLQNGRPVLVRREFYMTDRGRQRRCLSMKFPVAIRMIDPSGPPIRVSFRALDLITLSVLFKAFVHDGLGRVGNDPPVGKFLEFVGLGEGTLAPIPIGMGEGAHVVAPYDGGAAVAGNTTTALCVILRRRVALFIEAVEICVAFLDESFADG